MPAKRWLTSPGHTASDLLNILDRIGAAGATFKSLADAWADTTTPSHMTIARAVEAPSV